MGQPAARQGDSVTGADTHIVMVPAPPGSPVPTPIPGHVFQGTIDTDTSSDVLIEGAAAAVVGSGATNNPPHLPMPPGVSFQSPPSNRGEITQGSATVQINGAAAARVGDLVKTCNDPTDLETSAVSSGAGTVMIG